MKRVNAYKAQPVGSSTPEAVTILIKDEFPNLADADTADATMNIDAAAIAGALWDSLPGGTLDRLCAEMMRRQVSRLRVARR